jgi:glycerol uptake facilitator-like aquaporin
VTAPLTRRLLAEFLGSAFLAALVIGSGIAAANLSHDVGLRLLENAAATAAGLFAIILMFGPVSGGHFNPVVSLVDAAFGGLSRRDALAYIPAQIAGCITGAVVANAMFSLAAISISTHHRASPAHLFAEVIATIGLILVIFALARSGRISTAPAAVGAYIGAAYWFTSSTSFANPAIDIGRMFSNTFAGIAPASVPGFIVAQLAGGAIAIAVVRALYPDIGPATAADVVVPHDEPKQPVDASCRSHRRRKHGRGRTDVAPRREVPWATARTSPTRWRMGAPSVCSARQRCDHPCLGGRAAQPVRRVKQAALHAEVGALAGARFDVLAVDAKRR